MGTNSISKSQLFFFRWLHAQSLLSVAHLELVVAAFLRNASIGHVNLNSMSEVTGASTSRLHDAEDEDETAEWVLERRLLEPLASEIFTLSFVTFIHSLFLIRCVGESSNSKRKRSSPHPARIGSKHHTKTMLLP